MSINLVEGLEQGVEYKLLIEGSSRKARFTFEKVTRSYTSETEFVPVMEFKSKSGTKWLMDEHIISIELAEPLKPKQKKGITCTRCLGNKRFEKFAHINGGKCFKCEGTGII